MFRVTLHTLKCEKKRIEVNVDSHEIQIARLNKTIAALNDIPSKKPNVYESIAHYQSDLDELLNDVKGWTDWKKDVMKEISFIQALKSEKENDNKN